MPTSALRKVAMFQPPRLTIQNWTAPITTPQIMTGMNILRTPGMPSIECAAINPISGQVRLKNRAAGGPRISCGSPVAAISAWKDEPIEPNVTPQPCPSDGTTTAASGVSPIPISSGAVTATGTPNPPTPCKNEANTQPMISACRPRSGVRLGKAWPIVWIAPASSTTRKSRKAAQMIMSTSMEKSRALACA